MTGRAIRFCSLLTPKTSVVLAAWMFFGNIALSQVAAQSAPQAQAAAPTKPTAPAARPAPVWQGAQLNRLSRRAEMYYQGVFGVDQLRVKVAESGQLIRFNYRVLDPEKAVALNDKKADPQLFDPQAGVKLPGDSPQSRSAQAKDGPAWRDWSRSSKPLCCRPSSRRDRPARCRSCL